ncbi:hypothetical protein SAY86_031289 [Trapa natans]|uniref:Myb/SANT-like DNA-binding domain-containing protein n=1 Tax=Trapa natans TaxID=22666 RepID=A0AAN7R849_TRANT|nr:hypothetical protein SAY86_031289 [Trapa natans]
MIPGSPSFGDIDLQRWLQIQHQGPAPFEGFPPTMSTLQSCDQRISRRDFNKRDGCKSSVSDEDNRSLTEDGVDNSNDMNRWKNGSPWQRVKWTDKMVKLLITAVSYMGEDSASDCRSGGRRKLGLFQKKGKWKSVSKVLAERGYHVSPQQCEDKFNDLNKRYKKLNDMLGRGTSCQVVENPALLDVIDYLMEKEKDNVRKILSSKQLFYEEMCSYHNGNRLHLPPDPELQRSLQLALRSRDDNESNDARVNGHDDLDDDDKHDFENYDQDDYEEMAQGPAKRMKQTLTNEEVNQDTSLHNPHECNKGSHSLPQPDMNQRASCGARAAWLQKPMMESQLIQLEEQKLHIEMEMLELEKQKFKWERFCRKKDRELEKMRVENERMKLKNEQLALELKRKEMGFGVENKTRLILTEDVWHWKNVKGFDCGKTYGYFLEYGRGSLGFGEY